MTEKRAYMDMPSGTLCRCRSSKSIPYTVIPYEDYWMKADLNKVGVIEPNECIVYLDYVGMPNNISKVLKSMVSIRCLFGGQVVYLTGTKRHLVAAMAIVEV